jgi:hypothetical protein
MGRVPYGPPYSASPDIFDFYRFTSAGNRLIHAGTGQFSIWNTDATAISCPSPLCGNERRAGAA